MSECRVLSMGFLEGTLIANVIDCVTLETYRIPIFDIKTVKYCNDSMNCGYPIILFV